MKTYLQITNLVLLIVAGLTGAGFGYVAVFNAWEFEKFTLLIVLVFIFVPLYLLQEIGAIRRLEIPTHIVFSGNPRLRLFLIEIFFWLVISIFIFHEFEINGLRANILFALVVYMFIGAFFEICRLLRRPR